MRNDLDLTLTKLSLQWRVIELSISIYFLGIATRTGRSLQKLGQIYGLFGTCILLGYRRGRRRAAIARESLERRKEEAA